MSVPVSAVPLQAADWADGLITEQLLYWYTAGFMGFVAVVFLLWMVRLPSQRRKYAFVAVYASAVLCATYVGMAQGLMRYEALDGSAVPVTRFVGYGFGITVFLWMLGIIGGHRRLLRAALLLPFLGITLGTLGGWFLEPPFSRLASVSSLLSLPLIAYLLLGPGASAAAATTDDRRLLYGKLANVVLLAWLGYLVVGIVSRQNLALLDAFAGVFIGTYIDVLLHVGYGVLLLRGGVALDQLAAGDDGDEGPDDSTDESVDADGDEEFDVEMGTLTD